MKTFYSDISGREFSISERVSGRTVRPSILKLIQEDNPRFTPDQFLSVSELKQYKEKYIEYFLTTQIGDLTEEDKTVIGSLKENTTLTDKLDADDKKAMSFGQKVADKVAEFGGSWTFIISFTVFLLVWILINIYWFANKGFDPYPFILLNLILSALAAIQAPVIMMSQNRQEDKDRDRAKKDYMVNLKSEFEIRMLHEKIDHLIQDQQKEISEIRDLQNEMISKLPVERKSESNTAQEDPQ